ncbi:MAG: SH3 domain-containing protein [Treponema sp.]
MKRSVLYIVYSLLCIAVFSSCSKKIGYGVVNWSIPEYNLQATDTIPVLVRSNISKVYIVEINKQKVEIPLWQLTLCASKKEAELYIKKLQDYRSIYAVVKHDGLPLRSAPENTSKPIYRLRENQVVKILWKGEGEPVMVRDKPLEGDWFQVMTGDGTRGWCFSYNLSMYDERSSSIPQPTAEVEVDEVLESILKTRWYPDYYNEMITKKQIDPERMSAKFGFFPADPAGTARIVLQDEQHSFTYSTIRKNRMGAYLFEASPFVMQMRNDHTIGVHYSDEKGKTHIYYFTSLEENPGELAEQELNRRAALLQALRDIGPVFQSGNYGSLQFLNNRRFRWHGYHVISPAIIPKEAGSVGTVAIRSFISSKLKTEYQGILSFKFDGYEGWLDFFYTVSNQGLKLEYVKPENIQDGAVVTRNINPIILFFGTEGDES